MSDHNIPDGAEKTAPTPSVRELFARQLLNNTTLPHDTKLEQIVNHNRAQRQVKDAIPVPLKVGIIGSGMAGLYSAMILKDLGIDYQILEGNSERLGGRIYTYRYPQQQDRYQYFDIGAMRYPKIQIMDRLLGTQPWSLFSKLKNAGHEVPLIPYHLSNDNNIVYYNGKRIFASDSLNGDPLYFSDTHNGGPGTAVPDKYCDVPYTDFLYTEYDKFADEMAKDFNAGFNNLLEADNNSTRSYLFKRLYPQPAINFFETMETGSGLYDMAFSESVMDYFDFSGSEWMAIDGGSEIMVQKMLAVLGMDKIQQGKMVTKITKALSSNGQDGLNVYTKDAPDAPQVFQHVISTGTLAAHRKMDLNEVQLTHNARLAIRTLHYDHSVKISLAFKSRWWEDSTFMKGRPIFGGSSSTDLPVRTIVYPSYGDNQQGVSGVLIVSYTWSQDASRIGSLVGDAVGEAELIELCLGNLAEVHDVEVQTLKDMLVDFKCWDWYNDDFAMGAFALYSPAQFTQLFPSLTVPAGNGRFHFAGEATSVHHAWVIGSLNSAYRAVDHVLMVEGLEQLRGTLRERWGEIDPCEDPIVTGDDSFVYVDKTQKAEEIETTAKKQRVGHVLHSTKAMPKLLATALAKKPHHGHTAAVIGGLKR